MDLGSWLGVVAGAGGAVVAIYGAEILLIGRATRGDRNAFWRLADAGRYYLFFGLALVVLVSAMQLTGHDQPLLTLLMIIVVVGTWGPGRPLPPPERRAPLNRTYLHHGDRQDGTISPIVGCRMRLRA